MTSIFDDMNEMKRLADDIIGKGEKVIKKAYAPHGRCDVCGTELEYEPPFKGAHDEWPRAGGYWCTKCEGWS